MSFCLTACGENFLKLASEYGNYSTQQVRDIEEMRKLASDCNYDEKCFKRELDIFINRICDREEYEIRGFVSTTECERQYPYVFLTLFEQGKYASTDALQAIEDYKEAVKNYERERDNLSYAEEDYLEARREWLEAQGLKSNKKYRKATEDWEDAQDDYEEAWDDYREARKDYEKAIKEYNNFFGM